MAVGRWKAHTKFQSAFSRQAPIYRLSGGSGVESEQVVLITGANRGIGKSFLEAFLEKGVKKVYAAVRNPESAQALVDAHGEKVVVLALDLSKPETIQAAASQASDVTIVVNNGGILKQGSALSDQAITNLEEELQVNAFGLLHVARAFAPVLKANGGGVLAQLNSVVSLTSFPDFAGYCASKAASYSLTIALRAQLLEQNTRVISVHPGPIATDMANDAGMGDMGESPSLVADGLLEAIEGDNFHVFPDSMAKDFGAAYASFAENIILAQRLRRPEPSVFD